MPPPRLNQSSNDKGDVKRVAAQLRRLVSELPKASAQSAALWMAGDALCQKLEKSHEGGDHSSKGFDFRRTVVNAIYGGVFLGPAGHLWYNAMDATVAKALPGGGARMIAVKLVADLGLFGPAYLAAYLAWNAAAAAADPRKASNATASTAEAGASNKSGGESGAGGTVGATGEVIRKAVEETIRKDFFPALVVDTLYWLPVQAVNFAVVPVSKQLLFVNLACTVDAAFLSWLGSHSGELGAFWKELKERKQKQEEENGV